MPKSNKNQFMIPKLLSGTLYNQHRFNTNSHSVNPPGPKELPPATMKNKYFNAIKSQQNSKQTSPKNAKRKAKQNAMTTPAAANSSGQKNPKQELKLPPSSNRGTGKHSPRAAHNSTLNFGTEFEKVNGGPQRRQTEVNNKGLKEGIKPLGRLY